MNNEELSCYEYKINEAQASTFKSLLSSSAGNGASLVGRDAKLKPAGVYLRHAGDEYSFIIPKTEVQAAEGVHEIGEIFNFYGQSYIKWINDKELEVSGGNTYVQRLIYNSLIIIMGLNLAYLAVNFGFKYYDHPAIITPSTKRYYESFYSNHGEQH